ncbi:MAG: thermonuclease family protein [Actinomycetes bacterium]
MSRTGVFIFAGLACALLAMAGCAADSKSAPPVRAHQHRTPSLATPSTAQHRLRPDGPVSRGWQVSRVVDGDTVEVSKGGRELTVRLIGIDTPETVHPTEPIECYGPEASSFASRVLNDRRVLLEFDPSQGRLDYYGRTLAYLWLDGQRLILFNKQAVRRGFALEYTYNSAYQWQSQLQRAEKRAQRQKLGVWQCPTPGS